MKSRRLITVFTAVILIVCFAVSATGCGKENLPAEHSCNHVCEVCGKCTDLNCTDEVCSEKCLGHEQPEHTQHVFVDGKCECGEYEQSEAGERAREIDNLTAAIKKYVSSTSFSSSLVPTTTQGRIPLGYLNYLNDSFETQADINQITAYMEQIESLIGNDGYIWDSKWAESEPKRTGWNSIADYVFSWSYMYNQYARYCSDNNITVGYQTEKQAVINYTLSMEALISAPRLVVPTEQSQGAWGIWNQPVSILSVPDTMNYEMNRIWITPVMNPLPSAGQVQMDVADIADDVMVAAIKAAIPLKAGELDDWISRLQGELRYALEYYEMSDEQKEAATKEPIAYVTIGKNFLGKPTAKVTLATFWRDKYLAELATVVNPSLTGAFCVTGAEEIIMAAANLGVDVIEQLPNFVESMMSFYEKDGEGNYVKDSETPNWNGFSGRPLVGTLLKDEEGFDMDYEKSVQYYFPTQDTGMSTPAVNQRVTIDKFAELVGSLNGTFPSGSTIYPEYLILTGMALGLDMKNYYTSEGEGPYDILGSYINKLPKFGGVISITSVKELCVVIAYLCELKGIKAPSPIGTYNGENAVINVK